MTNYYFIPGAGGSSFPPLVTAKVAPDNTYSIRVPSGRQLDWLKSAVAEATVCATGEWEFKELVVLEGGQERKLPEARLLMAS